MLQVVCYLLVGIIIGIPRYFIIREKKAPLRCIRAVLLATFSVNILALGILMKFFRRPYVLDNTIYSSLFFFKYLLFALCIGMVWLFITGVIYKKIELTQAPRQKWWIVLLLKFFSFLFYLAGILIIFFSRWFINFFGEITPEQFLFNLSSPIKGTSNDMYGEILRSPLFTSLFVVTPILLVILGNQFDLSFSLSETKIVKWTKKNGQLVIFLFSLVTLLFGGYYGVNKLNLIDVYHAYYDDSSFIQENYIKPSKKIVTFPTKKRNLIHIYLESIENSYLSEDLGGYMQENLMPELSELAKEGIQFSQNEQMGGPFQTYGSSWSVASMINMGVGIPLKIPSDTEAYGKNGYFLPGAVALGDILEKEGYEQTIMFGADADFGGLTTYFTEHGHFNIFDVKYAREQKLIPKDYNVWWGFEDDKLYSFAQTEISRLANTGKPFNFTMETADTHFPDGYLSEKAPTPHESHYANAISYSTAEAVKFIKWIQKQDFYENTTIIVTGDHLSMDKEFFKDFNPDYHRTVFNLILNSVETTENTKNRQFSPSDFFPTTLSSLGVKIKGDGLGLGTDLFSHKKTLIEAYGLEEYNTELSLRSNFYNDEFVSKK